MKRWLITLGLVWALVLSLAPQSNAAIRQTFVGDAAYSITISDTWVSTSVAFTAARTWTLPSAGGTNVPASLVVMDVAFAITSTNTLTLAPQSGETINGSSSSLVIAAAGGRVILTPTSGSNWIAITEGPGATGSIVSSAIASASAVSLTSTTAANITSVSLTAGDWDCRGAVTRKLAASTSVTLLKTSISQTSATSGSLDTGTMKQWSTAANVMAADTTDVIGPIQQQLTATTTVYLVAQDTFSVSTNSGYGQLACRKVR